jgi:5-methylcytosine-specific restriction endonuclease McrA
MKRTANRKAVDRYQAAHPERVRACKATHRSENLDKMRAREATYRAANAGKRRAAARIYRAAHPERTRAAVAAWASSHPAETRARSDAWAATNPEKVREITHRIRVRRANAEFCNHAGCIAVGPVQLAWQINAHVCYLCGVPVYFGKNGNLNMDHVVPLVRGGLHCADNLRPACKHCNQVKAARFVDEMEALA